MSEEERKALDAKMWQIEVDRVERWGTLTALALVFLPWPVLYLIGQYIN